MSRAAVYGWGIMGIGRIADTEMAPAIAHDPRSRLVGVVSRDRGRAEAFAEKHGAQWAGTEYPDLLANPAVDVVLVTTPNQLHAGQVLAAIRAGKHVLCDKPLASSAAGAGELLKAADHAGVRVGLNFPNRFHPCFEAARQIVLSGEIGTVLQVQMEASSGPQAPAGWRAQPELAGLGVVNNICVHHYDLVRFVTGLEASEVVAMLDTGREIGIDLMANVLIRLDNGALAHIAGDHLTPYPFNAIVIHGTRGRISGCQLTRPAPQGTLRIVTQAGERSETYATGQRHQRLVEAFTQALADGRPPSPSGTDGLRSVQLTDAIARSAREGRALLVEP